VGSVRSVPGIHAVRALESIADLLVKFGGHPAAAGFTVPTIAIDAVRDRLGEYVESEMPERDLVPVREVDAEVDPAELDFALVQELERLGPFGVANPRPLFLLSGVRPFGIQVKGKDGSLLKFLVSSNGGRALEAVWWGRAELADVLQDQTVDLLVHLDTNTWNGETRLQLDVRDARLA
jgi:single-stranded-DNA-specific exonuclease